MVAPEEALTTLPLIVRWHNPVKEIKVKKNIAVILLIPAIYEVNIIYCHLLKKLSE